jgi:hypothetical protein
MRPFPQRLDDRAISGKLAAVVPRAGEGMAAALADPVAGNDSYGRS